MWNHPFYDRKFRANNLVACYLSLSLSQWLQSVNAEDPHTGSFFHGFFCPIFPFPDRQIWECSYLHPAKLFHFTLISNDGQFISSFWTNLNHLLEFNIKVVLKENVPVCSITESLFINLCKKILVVILAWRFVQTVLRVTFYHLNRFLN